MLKMMVQLKLQYSFDLSSFQKSIGRIWMLRNFIINLILFNFLFQLFTMFCQFLLYSKVAQSYTHTHTHIILLILYSIISDQMQFPVLYSRTSLLIHSKCNSLHPNFQSIPLLSPWQRRSVLHVCERFHSVDRLICATFQIPHVSDIIWYLSFSFSFSF